MHVPAPPKKIIDGFESRPVRSLKLNRHNTSDTIVEQILQAVSDQVLTHQQLGFTMAEIIKNHPYREATLIIPEKTSKDQA